MWIPVLLKIFHGYTPRKGYTIHHSQDKTTEVSLTNYKWQRKTHIYHWIYSLFIKNPLEWVTLFSQHLTINLQTHLRFTLFVFLLKKKQNIFYNAAYLGGTSLYVQFTKILKVKLIRAICIWLITKNEGKTFQLFLLYPIVFEPNW